MSDGQPAIWSRLADQHHADCKVYQVHKRRYRHPNDERVGDFYVMDAPDWVLALAVTPQRELVLVNQFRFGTDALSWEPPGGVIDPTDPDPVIAATRELLEETGYAGSNARNIGWCYPNPALQNNRSHFVYIEQCQQQSGQNLDPNEEIQVATVPLADAYQMATDGRISHSIAQSALLALQRELHPDFTNNI